MSKFKVGQTWLSRKGGKYVIDEVEDHCIRGHVEGAEGLGSKAAWFPNGKLHPDMEGEYDLVSLLRDEPASGPREIGDPEYDKAIPPTALTTAGRLVRLERVVGHLSALAAARAEIEEGLDGTNLRLNMLETRADAAGESHKALAADLFGQLSRLEVILANNASKHGAHDDAIERLTKGTDSALAEVRRRLNNHYDTIANNTAAIVDIRCRLDGTTGVSAYQVATDKAIGPKPTDTVRTKQGGAKGTVLAVYSLPRGETTVRATMRVVVLLHQTDEEIIFRLDQLEVVGSTKAGG